MPIIFGGLFLYSLLLWGTSEQSNRVAPHDQHLTIVEPKQPKLNELRSLGASLRLKITVLLLAVLSFVWLQLTDWIIYWQLLYLSTFSQIVNLGVIVLAGLIVGKWFQRLGVQELSRSERGQWGVVLTVATSILWVAVLPYVVNDYIRADAIQVENRRYNLMYTTNLIEDHARFEIYECDQYSFLCKQVVKSELDHCRSYQSGQLNYNQATAELSAELITCFRKMITYKVEVF